MKRKDITKLHGKELGELNKELTSLRVDMMKKRQEKRVGRLSNPRLIARLSDDIARIQTVIREKELQASEGNE